MTLTVDGAVVATQDMGPLPAGFSARGSLGWQVDCPVEVEVTVNPGGESPESRADDNSWAELLECNSGPGAVPSPPPLPSPYLPNLIVSGVSGLPASVCHNSTLKLAWTVANNGPGTASPFPYSTLSVGGNGPSKVNSAAPPATGGLGPTESMTFSGEYVVRCAGSKIQVLATADPSNSIAELNEADNSWSKTIPCVGAPEPLPNLLITGWGWQRRPWGFNSGVITDFDNREGETVAVRLHFTAKNDGAADARETVYALWMQGASTMSSLYVSLTPALSKGGSDTEYLQGLMPCDRHIWFHLDLWNSVRETNENDNFTRPSRVSCD